MLGACARKVALVGRASSAPSLITDIALASVFPLNREPPPGRLRRPPSPFGGGNHLLCDQRQLVVLMERRRRRQRPFQRGRAGAPRVVGGPLLAQERLRHAEEEDQGPE